MGRKRGPYYLKYTMVQDGMGSLPGESFGKDPDYTVCESRVWA